MSVVRQSNLSAIDVNPPRWGYDFVVAVTQDSINATMLNYLSGLDDTPTYLIWIREPVEDPNAGEEDEPTYQTIQVSHEDFLKRSNGADPFNPSLPKKASATKNPEVKKIADANFAFAIKYSLGIPIIKDNAPAWVPPVTLGSNTSRVQFNLLCSTLELVSLGWGPSGATFTKETQDAATNPWPIKTEIDLRLSSSNLGDKTAFQRLPPDAQARVRNLSANAFDINQLLFDFSNAGLASKIEIEGVNTKSDAYVALGKYFVESYFWDMKSRGEPILAISLSKNNVQPPAGRPNLELSDFNFQVMPYLSNDPTPARPGLATLNYLCAADGRPLPPAAPFTWNWMPDAGPNDAASNAQYHGVIAINRRNVVNYFHSVLLPIAQKNCYKPAIKLDVDKGMSIRMLPNQQATVTIYPKGSTILRYQWGDEAYDEMGWHGALAKCRVKTSYWMIVSLEGNTVRIHQEQYAWLMIEALSDSKEGNVVARKVDDVYHLLVDGDGRLGTSKPATTAPDHVETRGKEGLALTSKILNYFNNLNAVIEAMSAMVRVIANAPLPPIPSDAIKNYLFPGGNTFVFKNVGFSDFQDMLAYITYADK